MSIKRSYCEQLPDNWYSDYKTTSVLYRWITDAGFECIRKEFCPFVSLEAFKASPELKERATRSILFSTLPDWPGFCLKL